MDEQTTAPDVCSGGPTGEQIEQAVGAYQKVFARYRLMAVYLLKLLEHVKSKRCKTAIIQARPKTPSSVAGKIVKSWPKYQDPVNKMTDLCGARVIVPLLREATQMTAWLSTHFAITEYEDMLERLRPEAFGYRGEHLLISIDPRILPKELVAEDLWEQMPEAMKPLIEPEGPASQESEIEKLRLQLLLTEGPPVLTADLWHELHGLIAEVQVRTMAQHAWSDVGHDLIYKSPVLLPADHQRSSAKIAAMLEAADEELGDLVDKLEVIQKNARRYLDETEAESEIAQLKAVLSVDAGNLGVACNIVRSQLSIADYDGAAKTIEEFGKSQKEIPTELEVLRGRVLVARHRDYPHEREALESGRALLDSLVNQGHGGVEAATALADAWAIDGHRDKACQAFEMAYAIDSTDPRALTGYLRHQIAEDRGTRGVQLFRPFIEQAIGRCRQQIAARANLPDALFLLAELLLVSEESRETRKAEHRRRPGLPSKQRRESQRRELQSTYEGLYAACRAITLTPRRRLAALSEFNSRMDLLHKRAGIDIPGAEWARMIVQLACHLRSRGDEQMQKTAQKMGCSSNLGGKPLPISDKSVLIVAGGCDMSDKSRNTRQRSLLEAVAAEFEGLILSGGTQQGIAGLVGELCSKRNADAGWKIITTVGYLAENFDDEHATKDDRYTELRRTHGWEDGFSPLEPLQNWIDLLIESKVSPEKVRLLGINGGKIAAFEYHLAAALGAQTAVIRESGREADRLMLEEDQPGNENIMFLPSDSETVRAFVGDFPSVVEIKKQEACLAEQIDKAYKNIVPTLESQQHSDEIKRTFDSSNQEQARHMAAKLRRVGLGVAQSDDPREEQPLPGDKIEELAKMEHGRWVVERTLLGWRLGETRDNDKKTRPQLIPWEDLPDIEKKKDLNTVENIPVFLRACGLKIVALAKC